MAVQRGTILHSKKFEFINHGKLPEFRDMQMGIKRVNYPDILRYDSFIDCHKITPIPKIEFTNQLIKGDAQVKGILNDDDIDLILDVVRNSDLFSQSEKDTFFK